MIHELRDNFSLHYMDINYAYYWTCHNLTQMDVATICLERFMVYNNKTKNLRITERTLKTGLS